MLEEELEERKWEEELRVVPDLGGATVGVDLGWGAANGGRGERVR